MSWQGFANWHLVGTDLLSHNLPLKQACAAECSTARPLPLHTATSRAPTLLHLLTGRAPSALPSSPAFVVHILNNISPVTRWQEEDFKQMVFLSDPVCHLGSRKTCPYADLQNYLVPYIWLFHGLHLKSDDKLAGRLGMSSVENTFRSHIHHM